MKPTRTLPLRRPRSLARRTGAIGKALLVWLVSGSFGLALVAFLVFAMMGC